MPRRIVACTTETETKILNGLRETAPNTAGDVHQTLLAQCGGINPQLAMAATGGKLLPRLRRILRLSVVRSGPTAVLAAVMIHFVILGSVALPLACSATTKPATAGGLTFSQMFEKTTTFFSDDQPTNYLDLDTGQFVAPDKSKAIPAPGKGVDLLAGLGNSNSMSRYTEGMIVVAVPNERFAEAEPKEIIAALQAEQPSRHEVIGGKEAPSTYCFQTAEGNVGILTLLPVLKHADGVTVRWKLVQGLTVIKPEKEMEGEWGQPTDGLRCRWIVPEAPAMVGIAPRMSMEIQNVSHDTIFWECPDRGALMSAVTGVTPENTMIFPQFTTRLGKGVRVATADETLKHFGTGMQGREGADPIPGNYALNPGATIRLDTNVTALLPKPGRYEVKCEVARLPLRGADHPREKGIISCPPLTITAVNPPEVVEFKGIDVNTAEKDLNELVEKRGLKMISIYSGSPGGLPIQTIYHVFRADGEHLKVVYPKDKPTVVLRMPADAWYAEKLFNGLEKAGNALQVTLRAETNTCHSMNDLRLLADIVNTGAGETALFNDGSTGWELEVDGQLYESNVVTTAHAFMLGAGKIWQGLSVPADWMREGFVWRSKPAHPPGEAITLPDKDSKPLVLTPGKHTLRVIVHPVLDSGSSEAAAFKDNPSRMVVPIQINHGKPGRAISNAIEIEVLPAESGKPQEK